MKKLILLSALTVALVSGVIVFDTDRAYAATGQVVDRSTIKVGNQTFFDADIDSNFNYRETNASDGCADEIKGFSNSQLSGTSTPSEADIVISAPAGPGSSVCNDRTESITFGTSKSNFTKALAWLDNDTIKGSDGKLTFKRDGETNVFISEKNYGGCRDTLTVAEDNRTLSLRERKQYESGDHDYDWYPFNPGNRSYNSSMQCYEAPAINNIPLAGTPQDGNDGAAAGGSGSQSTVGQNTCEDSSADLSWMLCGILRIVDGAVGWLDNQIQDMLEVPQSYLNSPALEETWRRIRNIAVLILVPIVLVMVIGSALGFDFVSAYTVKRSLPRFLFAIVFLTLSFEITTFMIEFTNNVGRGLFGLMTSSFTDTGGSITLSSLLAPDGMSWEAGVFAGALVVAGAGAVAVGSIGVVLSFALVTVVALFVAFLLLAARQMILIALVILAPLAILAWVFPSNTKLWSLWWNAFTKLLMLFPLIIILIAGGRIFASIVRSVDGSGPVETLLVVTAYIAPYFFIPATFKLAGGIFATVAGIANDRERGLFDRNKKYRAEKRAQNYSEFKRGDKSWRPKSFNNIGRRIDAGAKGRFGVGAAGRGALDIRGRANAAEAMKDPLMNQLQFDDDGILAMSLSGGNRGDARQALVNYRERLRAAGMHKEADDWKDDRIDAAVATAGAVGYSRSNATAALDMMARNKSFSLAGGAAGIETMVEATDRLAGVTRGADGQVVSGNKAMADNLMGSFEYNSRSAGRMDLGMHDYKTGKADTAKAWTKATLSNHAQAAGPSTKVFADDAHNQLFKGKTAEDRKQAAIRILEMQNTLPYTTAGNQAVINQLMSDVGITFKPQQTTVTDSQGNQRVIETVRSAEDQLADILSGQGIDTTASALRGRARVYDSQGSAARDQLRQGMTPEA